MSSRRKFFAILLACIICFGGALLFLKHNYEIRHRTKKAPSPIVITTLPKSGSMSIVKSLSRFFHIPQMQFATLGFLDGKIEEIPFAEFVKKRAISQQHLPPLPANMERLERSVKKMVLHVRDPREALLSWVHHVDKLKEGNVTHLLTNLPLDYFSWSFSEKIDWQIDLHYKEEIEWLLAWKAYIEAPHAINILITRYEDLRDHPLDFFKNIVSFYGVNPKVFKEKYLPECKPGFAHYRKGDSQEWRHTLTTEQQERVNNLLTPALLQFYGWEL
ncbi:MAG: sulfotransferase domain-containing protein [Chlamydiales bacterium]